MLEKDSISRIKIFLKAHPKGLTITDISSRLKMNRNSVSKYLEVLLISGQVETQSYGTARVFFLTHRIPISAMLSISSHLVLTLDDSKKVIFCNDNFLTFFGIARDQIVGHHIIEIYRLGIPDITFSDLFSDVLVNPDHTCETAITKQNETYYFQIKGINTVFDDGCRGITIVMEDVTKERRHQLELELNEARYRGIVEDQTEFICRFLPDGTLTFINDSFAKFLSRTPEVLVNTCKIPGISCEDATLWDQACKTIDREHAVTTITCRMPDGTGRNCWTAWTIRGLFDGTDECREYQAVGRDITEKKEADAQLQAHVTQMEFFSRKMQEFSELPPDADIYEAIGAGLYEFLPYAAITVNSYDSGSGTLTVRNIISEQAQDSAIQHFGKLTVGLKIRVDENVPEWVLSGKLHHIEKDLYNVMFRHLPKEACEKITKALNLGEFYSVGLVWNGVLFGNITFGLQKGVPLTNVPLIEVYARVSSIALQRWIAEDKLMERERKFTEEALKGSENYLLTIFNSTQSGLVLIDPETHTIFDINSPAVNLIGKKKSEIVGSSCKALFCLAESDKCPVTDLHQNVVRKECNFLTNAGEKKVVLKTVVPVQIGSRSYLLESILDISERKKAEDALVVSEGKFRETVRLLDEGYYNCTPDGKLLEHNLAFNRILGIDPAHELSGISLTDFWQDPFQRQQYLAELTKKGFVQNYVINAKTIRGDEIVVLANSHVIRDEMGRITRIVGTFTDFTERKRAEDALRESEERYRSLAENARDFIYIIDKNDNVVYVNSYCQQMLKKSREDIVGKPRKALFPEPVATVQYQNLQQVFTTGIPLKEVNGVPIAGQEFWQDTQLVPLKDADGNISAVLGISRDITHLKQVENAIRESEESYRTLFSNVNDAIFLHGFTEEGLPGQFIEVNKIACDRLQYTHDELLGKSPHDIDAPETWAEAHKYSEKLFTEGYVTFEAVHVKKDGTRVPVEISAHVFTFRDQKMVLSLVRDITERKLAEGALHESEKKFRDLAEMLPQSVWECDAEGNLTFVNRRSFEMYGYDPEDFDKGLNIWQMMHPDDRERVKGEVVQGFMHAPSEFPEFYQYTALRKDGSTFPLEIYATMSVSKGQIMGMRGIGIDITERKIAEEELRESEERFRNIFNHAVEGILIADISTQKFLYANPAICTMLGYSAQELTSMGMSDIHPEKDLAHVQEEFMVQARGEKTLAKSLPVLRKDRDVRYMDINTTPVIIDGHHCNLGLFTDTTERNLAEEALCDTEERYKSLFDRSLDCVYLHDFTGNFIEANQAGLTLLGYTRDEITSLNFTSLLTPDQVSTALKVNQEILATGTQQKPAEFRVRRKDGGYVDVITIASIIYQNGKPYAVQGIAHDITERKRAEEALKDSEEKFRILSEQSVLGIGIIQDGIYQYFNEGYCVISGYSADEIRHWKPYEYAKTVHPDDREFVMDQIQKKQMNSPDVVTHYSFRGINKEGAVLVLDLYSKTIMYQGRPADFVTFIDITERKRVEEALHESEKK